MDMSHKETIKKFVRSNMIKSRNAPELLDDSSLIETGIIDSLGIQILIAYLEKTFSIKIHDDEIVPDNFETVEAIENLIIAKNK